MTETKYGPWKIGRYDAIDVSVQRGSIRLLDDNTYAYREVIEPEPHDGDPEPDSATHPTRIWAVHNETLGAIMIGEWADSIRHLGGVEYILATDHDAEVAGLKARIAELEAEAERRDEQISDMIEASGQKCACGYDKASDVCLGHLSHFRKSLTAERDAAYERAAEIAQQEAETSKRKCDSLSDYFDDFERGVLSGAGHTAKNIAAAIRAMKEGE